MFLKCLTGLGGVGALGCLNCCCCHNIAVFHIAAQSAAAQRADCFACPVLGLVLCHVICCSYGHAPVHDSSTVPAADMVAGKGLGNFVVVAPDIGVWEVLFILVLLLEVQVPGASLPVLPMLIH